MAENMWKVSIACSGKWWWNTLSGQRSSTFSRSGLSMPLLLSVTCMLTTSTESYQYICWWYICWGWSWVAGGGELVFSTFWRNPVLFWDLKRNEPVHSEPLSPIIEVKEIPSCGAFVNWVPAKRNTSQEFEENCFFLFCQLWRHFIIM